MAYRRDYVTGLHAMTIAAPPDSPPIETVADLIEQLGGIPPSRIRMQPPLGTATEDDVLAIEAREGRLFELIDGVLVEKGMGYRESLLAAFLIGVLEPFVRHRKLGLVSGADGMVRLFPRRVRIPDVAYVSWDRVPGARIPTEPIPDLVPDLAIEVLSESNTKAEMARKRREYLGHGGRLVWQVDPDTRTVEVFTEPEQGTVLHENDTLSGGDVLPEFTLSLKDLFAVLDRQAPAS